uniref:Transmembrane domain containing protein n=1 Tax=Marseillevirus sp. TaxID=2809551 RepID=A0AA96ERY5_9VIRU|nr:transmembrane domain containing protein [Marseillevirus sp.]
MSFTTKEKLAIVCGSYLIGAAGFAPLIVKDMGKEVQGRTFWEFMPIFLWRATFFPYYQTVFQRTKYNHN